MSNLKYSEKYHHIKPDWVTGYTTRHHLLLDLDNMSLNKVIHLVHTLMKEYSKIGNCLILRSSSPRFQQWYRYPPLCPVQINTVRHNYHAVFSSMIGFEYCCQIIETLAELDVIERNFIHIRNMRQDMTLRVSRVVNVEQVKPKPVMVMFIKNMEYLCDNQGIKLYMNLYNMFANT